MDSENKYLNNPNTIAICQLRGFIFSTYEFTESDVFFNKNYFEMFKDDEQSIIVDRYATKTVIHEFGHVFGYMHTCWEEDIMLDVSHNVMGWNFENESSVTWKIHKLRDRMAYSRYFDQKPLMIPVDNSIVDVAQMSYTAGASEGAMLAYMYEVIDTNLRGRPGDPLEVAIYQGWQDRSCKSLATDAFDEKTPVIQVFSEGIDNPVYLRGISFLHLDNQQNLNKILAAIDDYGEPQTLGKYHYSSVLKGTIVVRGFLTARDKHKHTIFSNVYLTYSDILNWRRRTDR